jgi:hypothetical protein
LIFGYSAADDRQRTGPAPPPSGSFTRNPSRAEAAIRICRVQFMQRAVTNDPVVRRSRIVVRRMVFQDQDWTEETPRAFLAGAQPVAADDDRGEIVHTRRPQGKTQNFAMQAADQVRSGNA